MWMGVFMLVREMALEIRLLAKRGKGLRVIAREIGVSRNTVRRYLRDGDADRLTYPPECIHSDGESSALMADG